MSENSISSNVVFELFNTSVTRNCSLKFKVLPSSNGSITLQEWDLKFAIRKLLTTEPKVEEYNIRGTSAQVELIVLNAGELSLLLDRIHNHGSINIKNCWFRLEKIIDSSNTSDDILKKWEKHSTSVICDIPMLWFNLTEYDSILSEHHLLWKCIENTYGRIEHVEIYPKKDINNAISILCDVYIKFRHFKSCLKMHESLSVACLIENSTSRMKYPIKVKSDCTKYLSTKNILARREAKSFLIECQEILTHLVYKCNSHIKLWSSWIKNNIPARSLIATTSHTNNSDNRDNRDNRDNTNSHNNNDNVSSFNNNDDETQEVLQYCQKDIKYNRLVQDAAKVLDNIHQMVNECQGYILHDYLQGVTSNELARMNCDNNITKVSTFSSDRNLLIHDVENIHRNTTMILDITKDMRYLYQDMVSYTDDILQIYLQCKESMKKKQQYIKHTLDVEDMGRRVSDMHEHINRISDQCKECILITDDLEYKELIEKVTLPTMRLTKTIYVLINKFNVCHVEVKKNIYVLPGDDQYYSQSDTVNASSLDTLTSKLVTRCNEVCNCYQMIKIIYVKIQSVVENWILVTPYYKKLMQLYSDMQKYGSLTEADSIFKGDLSLYLHALNVRMIQAEVSFIENFYQNVQARFIDHISVKDGETEGSSEREDVYPTAFDIHVVTFVPHVIAAINALANDIKRIENVLKRLTSALEDLKKCRPLISSSNSNINSERDVGVGINSIHDVLRGIIDFTEYRVNRLRNLVSKTIQDIPIYDQGVNKHHHQINISNKNTLASEAHDSVESVLDSIRSHCMMSDTCEREGVHGLQIYETYVMTIHDQNSFNLREIDLKVYRRERKCMTLEDERISLVVKLEKMAKRKEFLLRILHNSVIDDGNGNLVKRGVTRAQNNDGRKKNKQLRRDAGEASSRGGEGGSYPLGEEDDDRWTDAAENANLNGDHVVLLRPLWSENNTGDENVSSATETASVGDNQTILQNTRNIENNEERQLRETLLRKRLFSKLAIK